MTAGHSGQYRRSGDPPTDRADGEGLAAIAKQLGVARSTAYRLLEQTTPRAQH
jgi:hypothetical protein